jgi:hypothetical protein
MASSAELNSEDSLITKFNTYDDYLDYNLSPNDKFYLDNLDMARFVIQIGGRKVGLLTQHEFVAKKNAIMASQRHRLRRTRAVARQKAYNTGDSPFLAAIAARDAALGSGSMVCILYLLARNRKGQEVSGYIDLGERLFDTDYSKLFSGDSILLPTRKDLSYYNWATRQAHQQSESSNFQFVPNAQLSFLVKADQSILNLNSKPSTVLEFESGDSYIEAAFFDHHTKPLA